MSAWVTIPSARPVEEVNRWAAKWKQRGYNIAILRDEAPEERIFPEIDLVIMPNPPGYKGYARSANALIQIVTQQHPDAEWFVVAGDDTDPDQHRTAEEIAAQCKRHFGKIADVGSTFGCMQPTGDRFAQGSIDRIAGSPWIGREFARRVYKGQGPYWPEYTSMFVDEELKCVAEKYGVYWMRPDLVHLHRHFMRESEALDSRAVQRPIPPHLVEANSPEHWAKFKALFESRKIHGFPGSELIP